MTPLEAILRDEIAQNGPIPFARLMELALYHPSLGYYTREQDPFGRGGDFFTAEQLQPVYGRLMASTFADLRREMGEPDDFRVVELGAGRQEMAEAFTAFGYIPIERNSGQLPEQIAGVVFANEFFDALPVEVAARRGELWIERLVTFENSRFVFVDGGSVSPQALDYLACVPPEQTSVELHFESIAWLKRIANRLERGYVLIVDYGYTNREALRLVDGSLMSYRGHVASEQVLADPGERDITSHLPFSVLMEEGRKAGLETARFETLRQFLVRVGERDQFAEAVRGGHEMQLKTLLYGLGETFRVLLLQKKNGAAEATPSG